MDGTEMAPLAYGGGQSPQLYNRIEIDSKLSQSLYQEVQFLHQELRIVQFAAATESVMLASTFFLPFLDCIPQSFNIGFEGFTLRCQLSNPPSKLID